MKPEVQMTVISTEEYIRRWQKLCLSHIGPILPRKRRDLHIALKSAALSFNCDSSYTEPEVIIHLKNWLSEFHPLITVDHASLRRALVDEGFLMRNSAGSSYTRAAAANMRVNFESTVDQLNPVTLIANAKLEIAERKSRSIRPH